MSEKKIVYCENKTESVRKYNEYVRSHIKNVNECYNIAINAFKSVFPNVYEDLSQASLLLANLKEHDESKFSMRELFAYANRFFPKRGTDPESIKNKRNFKMAWLHHIHKNKHHPAHWVFIDNGNIEILDMPDVYIIEMLCDWMAMSRYYNSTTLEYWNSESAKKLPMSDYTKSKVNEFMRWMQENNVHTLW